MRFCSSPQTVTKREKFASRMKAPLSGGYHESVPEPRASGGQKASIVPAKQVYGKDRSL